MGTRIRRTEEHSGDLRQAVVQVRRSTGSYARGGERLDIRFLLEEGLAEITLVATIVDAGGARSTFRLSPARNPGGDGSRFRTRKGLGRAIVHAILARLASLGFVRRAAPIGARIARLLGAGIGAQPAPRWTRKGPCGSRAGACLRPQPVGVPDYPAVQLAAVSPTQPRRAHPPCMGVPAPRLGQSPMEWSWSSCPDLSRMPPCRC